MNHEARRVRRSPWQAVLWGVALCAFGLRACTASSTTLDVERRAEARGGVAGAAGAPPASTTPTGAAVVIVPDDVRDPPPTEAFNCGNSTVERAEPAPIDVVLLVSRSNTTAERPVEQGVAGLVADPGMAGVRMGLGFIPFEREEGEITDYCDVKRYSTLAVPLGELEAADFDPQETAILERVKSAIFSAGQTAAPLTAVRGALGYLMGVLRAHPEERAVLAVISPDEYGFGGFLCERAEGAVSTQDEAWDELERIVGLGYEMGVRTFFLGVSSASGENWRLRPVLERLAAAGGGEFLRAGDEDSDSLADRLREIAVQDFACEYSIPEPESGAFDPGLVNVRYRKSNGEPQNLYYYPEGAESCRNALAGWHYDDPEAPTRIVLCETTCASARQAEDPAVQIILGCPPVVEVPR